ncbi:MAG: N-acetylmuramoyl-L-alanine amidase [Gammaproteobacteria bacterium]
MRLIALILGLFCLASQAADLAAVRVESVPAGARVTLELSGPVRYSVFTMAGPDRLVVDLYDIRRSPALPAPGADARPVQRIRGAVRNRSDYRLVLDLQRAVPFREALVAADGQRGHRLVIDFAAGAGTAREAAAAPAQRPATAAAEPAPRRAELPTGDARHVVVAIDPGHGGEDPGAIGRRGTREKDITLAVSRKLMRRINQEHGMRAVLTRDSDEYVGLRERMNRARERRADLFVSIHADAFKNASVRGSSVYVLSQRGASSEAARWLAEQENAADLVGGVSLEDKDHLLKSVLIDLSQSAALEASVDVARQVLRELGSLGRHHHAAVQYAGFMVLKSPDIPSILVETAFISNPAEEARLRTGQYQEALAGAILSGVRAYFRANPPPGTLLAAGAGGGLLADSSGPQRD